MARRPWAGSVEREADASLVEQPTELAESMKELGLIGIFPHHVQMRDPSRHVLQIGPVGLRHLIRNIDVVTRVRPTQEELCVAMLFPALIKPALGILKDQLET